jgi:hypothetical protein
MDKASKDKSSPLKDYNSPDKLLRSSEELKQEKLEVFLSKRKLLKFSERAQSAVLLLDNKEDKI